jgi:DNA-binding Lrp family transcriptional regulator
MLTPKEKIFLKKLQTDFPLTPRPFATLAKKSGLSEQEMLAYFKKLHQKGVLRYIAAMFDLRKLGITSSLIAMRVPLRKIDRTVSIINACPNVSHNYLRKDDYNVWFTVSAASERRLKSILREIRKKTGISDLLDLRTQRVFKSQAVFELK